jgi:hypothetical protein
MVLQQQTVPFLFQGGLNSKTDTFQLASPQLLQADNVRFTQDGAVSKRTGFSFLTRNIVGGGVLSAGVAIQAFNGELLAFDGIFIYSYVESQSAWINRGVAISVINNQRKIESTSISQQNNPDGTNLDGLELYVWEDSHPVPPPQETVRYSILDTATGAFVVSDKLLYSMGNSTISPRVKALAVPRSHQINLYYEPSTSELFLNSISTVGPEILLPFTRLISDGNATLSGGEFPQPVNFPYDVCLVTGQSIIDPNAQQAAVAYASSTGIQTVVDGHFTAQVPGIFPTVIATCGGANNAWWIAYSTTGESGAGTFVFNVITKVITQIDALSAVNIAIIEDVIAGNLNISYEIDPGAGLPHYLKFAIWQSNNTVAYELPIQRKVGLASKPFKINNNVYINTIFQSTRQSTYFTLCLTQNKVCISKINPAVGGTYRTNGELPQCDNFASLPSQFMFANQKKGAFQTNNNLSFSLLGVNASYIQFTNINAFNSLSGANSLHIVGGVEKVYDGISVVEDNFHLYAETTAGFGANIDGFTTPTPPAIGNQYQYVIVYTWSNNNGLIQRGQPSVPITILVATNTLGAILQIPTLTITDKVNPRSPISIEVYRTIITLGVPSSIFYKITDDANNLVVNDPTVDYVYFTDNASDDSVKSNEPLYTASQLYNQAPPACSLIAAFATRICLSGMEDPNVIWISQDRFELDNYNTIPIEFSPLLIEGIRPDTDEQITAIQDLDSNFVVFKPNTIFSFSGDGPNANATAGGYNPAAKVPSDTGCSNPNSIVDMPGNDFNSGGLMYQSAKGIYLLDRGYINHYIGKDVEKYNYLTITSAQLLENQNEVVFLSEEGIVLCYNYLFNRWTTWSYLPSIDSCIWNNQLAIMQEDGTVLVQKDALYTDYASNTPDKTKPIVRTIQLPWLAFAGIQGFQSVFHATVLGHYASPHILNMAVCYDYDPSPREPVAINSNMVSNVWGGLPLWGSPPNWGGGPFTPYQFQYNFDNPWCQALSMIIWDDPLPGENQGGNDQGGILSAITFQVGIFSDTVRLPAKNKVSGVKFSGTNNQ